MPQVGETLLADIEEAANYTLKYGVIDIGLAILLRSIKNNDVDVWILEAITYERKIAQLSKAHIFKP